MNSKRALLASVIALLTFYSTASASPKLYSFDAFIQESQNRLNQLRVTQVPRRAAWHAQSRSPYVRRSMPAFQNITSDAAVATTLRRKPQQQSARKKARRTLSTEITFDASYYYYEEPNVMSDTSDPVFLSLGLRDWDIDKSDSPWHFLYTIEITRGWVKYDGSGTLDKDYYKFRGEALAGYKIGNFIPIVGLGYRWLYDDSGGLTSSTGALGYDRQSQYLYIPSGAVFEFNEKLKIKGQFNYLLAGMQTSYLSDIAGFSDIENDQTSGWGTDITVDYKINEKLSVYSFYRYWDIDKSDISIGTFAGVLLFQAFEPANTTTEVGIGFSYKF